MEQLLQKDRLENIKTEEIDDIYEDNDAKFPPITAVVLSSDSMKKEGTKFYNADGKAVKNSISFSPLDIFDSENRKNIDIFLILWFISSNLIIIASFVFLFFPGYVMYFALSQIYLLFIDKNLGAMESIRESYRITYGEKWQILFSKFLGNIGIYILGSIIISFIYFAIYYFFALFMDSWDLYRLLRWVIQPLMVLIFISFIFAFNASMNAYIYSKLRDK